MFRLLGFKRKKTARRDVDITKLIPERTVTCEEDAETGRFVVLMPRYTGPLWGRFLQPRMSPEKRFIRVPLEDRGSVLWRHIDGQRTIGDLIDIFCEAFAEDSEQASQRVGTYLFQMSENGFLRLCEPVEQD